MTDLRTAAQHLLEAWDGGEITWFKRAYTVMENLRATLAEPMQEPVAWMRPDNRVAEESYSRTQFSRGRDKPPIGTWMPLYTAPPRTPLAEAAQEPQGCDHCNHWLYAGIKCRMCGRVTEAAP